jgi:hypothetical protein
MPVRPDMRVRCGKDVKHVGADTRGVDRVTEKLHKHMINKDNLTIFNSPWQAFQCSGCTPVPARPGCVERTGRVLGIGSALGYSPCAFGIGTRNPQPGVNGYES